MIAGSGSGLAYLGFPQPTPYGEALRKGGANIGHPKSTWPVYRGSRIALLAVDLHMIIAISFVYIKQRGGNYPVWAKYS